MNLHDCAVPYTALPESVLSLNSKVSILTAIALYRTGNVAILEDNTANGSKMTRYQVRQLSEIRDEFVRKGVVIETEDGLQLHPLDMMADRTLAKTRIVLPSRFDYRTLTLTALKVLLACYSITRYSRTPFQFTVNQRELADRANVSEKSARDALRQLEDSRLLRAVKKWKTGSKITMLEPESGVELFYIGQYYKERADRVPVFDRYKYLLSDLDPKDKLKDTRGPLRSYYVFCPFCKSNRKGTSFQFDSTDEGDHWRCFNCHRSGKSDRLWARLANWEHRTDWRQIIADVCPMTPVAFDPSFDDASAGPMEFEEMEQQC